MSTTTVVVPNTTLSLAGSPGAPFGAPPAITFALNGVNNGSTISGTCVMDFSPTQQISLFLSALTATGPDSFGNWTTDVTGEGREVIVGTSSELVTATITIFGPLSGAGPNSVVIKIVDYTNSSVIIASGTYNMNNGSVSIVLS